MTYSAQIDTDALYEFLATQIENALARDHPELGVYAVDISSDGAVEALVADHPRSDKILVGSLPDITYDRNLPPVKLRAKRPPDASAGD